MGHGNSITDLLTVGLQASRLQGRAIANNIANLNTPGYRRVEANFEELLAQAAKSARTGKPMPEGTLSRPMNTEVKPNGNDVDLDVEVGEMIKNSGTYKTYMRVLARQYRAMEIAMQD